MRPTRATAVPAGSREALVPEHGQRSVSCSPNRLVRQVYSSGILRAMAQDSRHAAQVRWLSAAQLIGVVRSEPGVTRATAAQRLDIGSGGATELVARMRRARLIEETPAPAQGRGRPTT